MRHNSRKVPMRWPVLERNKAIWHRRGPVRDPSPVVSMSSSKIGIIVSPGMNIIRLAIWK